MDAATAEEMAIKAGRGAVKRARENEKKEGRLIKAAIGTQRIRTVSTEAMWMQRTVPKRLDTPKQVNQRGLWFPQPGTRVTAFWVQADGKETLGGTKGENHTGTVGNIEWQEGDVPKFVIEYDDGSEYWHDIVDEAGTSVRMIEPNDMASLVTVPQGIRNMLGHGTE